MYPVVFFDALRVKIRDEATVRSQAIYLALAVLPDGARDILGLWIEQTEGAKFLDERCSATLRRGAHFFHSGRSDCKSGESASDPAVKSKKKKSPPAP